MEFRDKPTGGVPVRWLVCFSRSGSGGWIDWVTFGRHKHASAFARVPGLDDIWLFYDVRQGRTVIGAATGELARRTMAHWAADCDVVAIDVMPDRPSIFTRLGFWCAPAIRHLLGLRGALPLPSILYRDCIRAGGTIVESSAGPDRPPAGADGADRLGPAEPGAAGPGAG